MERRSAQISRRLAAVAVMGMLIVPVGSAYSDVIRLKNGNVLEGEIIGETNHKLFLRLPSGTVSFFKSRIQQIQRDERQEPEDKDEAEELLESGQLSGGAESGALYLRDGRRVDGTLKKSKSRVRVESMYGTVQFPRWLVDRSGLVKKQWHFVKRLDNPAAFDLLDELRLRREEEDARRRERSLRNQDEFELLEGKRARLEDLFEGKESAPLAQLARELTELGSRLGPSEQSRANDLAVNAYRAAADLERERGRAGASLATSYYAELVKLLYSGQARPGSRKLKIALQGFFESDPAFWEPGLRVLESLETYDWMVELPDLATAEWRSRSLPIGRLPDTGATRLFYVKSEHRMGAVETAPPNSVFGVEGVWMQEWEAASRGEAWRQVFWCPVQQAWKEDTVPEVLARQLRGVYEFLGQHVVLERRDTEEVFAHLTTYNQALDHLASVYYEPADGRLKDGWKEQFRLANQAYAGLQGVNERALRRRVHMQPALDHVATVHRLLLDAAAGIHVDFAVATPPHVVSEYTGGSAEVKAIVKALGYYDLRVRLQTLRGHAVLRHIRSGEVRDVVTALAASPFSLDDESRAAAQVLKEWEASR